MSFDYNSTVGTSSTDSLGCSLCCCSSSYRSLNCIPGFDRYIHYCNPGYCSFSCNFNHSCTLNYKISLDFDNLNYLHSFDCTDSVSCSFDLPGRSRCMTNPRQSVRAAVFAKYSSYLDLHNHCSSSLRLITGFGTAAAFSFPGSHSHRRTNLHQLELAVAFTNCTSTPD